MQGPREDENKVISVDAINNIDTDEPVEEEVIEDDFFLDYEEVNSKDINKLKEPKIIPSFTRKELNDFIEETDEEELAKSDLETKTNYYINKTTEEYINPDDIGFREDMGSMNNNPMFEDSPMRTTTISLKKRATNSKSALLKLSQVAGIGAVVPIPLWHSGFRITIEPLTNVEIINLELDLIDEIERIGKDTNTLIFSNYNILFAKVVYRHFKDKIIDSTLKLPEGEVLEDYIKINDLYTIALHLSYSMYPNGFNGVVPCKNSVKIIDGKPKCNFKAYMKFDLPELFWVDENKVPKELKPQMNFKTRNSVTTDEALAYQKILEESLDDVYIEVGAATIYLATPSLSRYFQFGDLFISDLKDKTTEIVKNNKQIESLEDAEKILVDVIKASSLNHFIDKIKVDDVDIADPNEINDAIETLSSNFDIEDKIVKRILKFIDETLVAVVGVPNFECKHCKTTQSKHDLIPLSVYDYFFILLHSKYEKITKKLEKLQ